MSRDARGLGVGRQLMEALESIALREYGVDGVVVVELSAQERAMGFYEALGYRTFNEHRYLDCEIWHRDMRKRLGQATSH